MRDFNASSLNSRAHKRSSNSPCFTDVVENVIERLVYTHHTLCRGCEALPVETQLRLVKRMSRVGSLISVSTAAGRFTPRTIIKL